MVGCLFGDTKIGSGNIATKVALQSIHLSMRRRGHLDQYFNIFTHRKKHTFSKILMNPSYMDIGKKFANCFNNKAECFKFYGYVKEKIMLDKTSVYGKPVEIAINVDTDNVGDKLTYYSHTGIIIFVNFAPILWYPKRQYTIKSSSFGSKVVDLRMDPELIKILHYKICMICVTLSGPTYSLVHNKEVVNGAFIAEWKFTKKHIGIFYHTLCKASSQGIWWVGFIKGKHNITDFLTDSLYGNAR